MVNRWYLNPHEYWVYNGSNQWQSQTYPNSITANSTFMMEFIPIIDITKCLTRLEINPRSTPTNATTSNMIDTSDSGLKYIRVYCTNKVAASANTAILILFHIGCFVP